MADAAADFCRAVGARIAHVTAAGNLDGIRAHGLHPAHALAGMAGTDPATLALRDRRRVLRAGGHSATLNHQLPILHGIAAAGRTLEGHTPASWAGALDRRVFFWPMRKGAAFARSVTRDVDTVTLWLDSARFAEALFDHIDLSPINSGNFRQGGAHARRGDWLFVPLAAGIDAFRENRRRRGLVGGRDAVAEISLRKGIGADLLRRLLISDAP